MSLFSSVKLLFNRGTETKADPTYGITAQFYSPGQPMWSDRNYRSFVTEGYKKCGMIYACVNKIADAAAGIKWKLFTDKSMKREIESHLLLDLWNKPNPRMGASELIGQIFGFWHLAGNTYLHASRLNPNEPPVELWPLFPDQMKIVAGQHDIQGYVYGYGGTNPRVYELEDIMHLKFPSYDERSFYGLSPIEVAMRTVDRLNAGSDWNMALMQNEGRPSALFTSKGYLTVEQRNQLKAELKKKYQGKRNAGMPLVLEADIDYKAVSLPPKELDWIMSRGFDERGICMIMDVPAILLSDYEGQTYSNRKEAKQSLLTENVLPKLDKTVGHINMWLVPMYEDLKRMGAYFSYDKKDIEVLTELYTEAEQALGDKATSMWNNGLCTLAHAQELQGIAQKKSIYLDVYKVGPATLVREEDLEQYAIACLEKLSAPPPTPFNQQPGLSAPKPTTVTEVDGGGKAPLQGNSTQNGKMQGVSPFVDPSTRYRRQNGTLRKDYQKQQVKVLDLTKEEKAAYMASLEEQRGTWETEIEQRLQAYFKAEQTLIAKALEACSTEQQVEAAIGSVLAVQEEPLQQEVYDLWYDVGQDFGEQTYNQLIEAEKTYNPRYQTKGFFDLFPAKIVAFLLNLSSSKVTQITETTRDQLKQSLSDGVAAGESILQIAKRIDQLYLEQIIPNRSKTIAATEVISSSNWASHAAAEESGLELMKVWLATGGSRTRPDHAKANGQKVAMNEPFVVGGYEMMYAGDGSRGAPAKEVCNCRCTQYYERVKDDDGKVVGDYGSIKDFMGVLV